MVTFYYYAINSLFIHYTTPAPPLLIYHTSAINKIRYLWIKLRNIECSIHQSEKVKAHSNPIFPSDKLTKKV